MNISVPELSQRLQKALDSNYNVKDEKSVYEIISTLEGTTVTREMLEATRLAKHINELRRKTTDQVLARRSKSLLKRWRDLLLPAIPTVIGGVINQPPSTNRSSLSTSSNLVPQQSRQTAAQFNQNGSMSSSGRPAPPNNRAPFISQQSQPPGNLIGQSSTLLSTHNISNNSSSLCSSSLNRISPNKLAALSHHQQMCNKHKENHQEQAFISDVKKLAQYSYNNNSLRIPSASSSRPGFAAPMEIINLTDDRSNSPSLFQQITKRSHSASPKVVRMNNDNSVDRPNSVAATTSANSKGVPSMTMLPNSESTASVLGRPLGMLMQNSKSMTCDNEYDSSNNIIGTSSSRKHKKHKKEKKSTSSKSAYNHIDERSAPNILTALDENSLNIAQTNANSLILPDNDSLSNTSASIFNVNNAHADISSNLSFAGHFSKAKTNHIDPSLLHSSNSIPTGATSLFLTTSRPGSRSVSPSIFISHHSNHSVGSVIGDPDIMIINRSGHASPVLPIIPSASGSQDLTQVKIPKKRGRKKGSKGIDSLLATHNEGAMTSLLNADSFSDLKQKITSISGTKKVKTTKELLADIQNKRSTSGNISTVTSPSVTQAPSPESLSEMSHHSQSTDAGMRSLRGSPEPSTSSALIKSQVPTPQSDDTSIEKKPEKTKETVSALPSSSTFVIEDIEVTIKRLIAQLPPIDYTVLDKTEDEEQLPKCTCILREVDGNDDENHVNDGVNESNKKVDNLVNIEVNIIKDSDEEMADAEIRERLKTRVKKKKREKTVKSIFDLDDDYDEADLIGNDGEDAEVNDSDDDDLESVPDEDVTNRVSTAKNSISAVLAAGESLSQQTATLISVPTEDSPDLMGPPSMPQFAKYEAVVDPSCAAMRYYETSRNDVTNFHIETLHSCFVPNVNGNWNHRNVPETAQNSVKTEEDTVSIDTANHVVPRYNYLSCDKIPKQFHDFQFDYKSYVAHRKDRDKRKVSTDTADTKQRLFSNASSMELDEIDYNNHHNNHLSEADDDSVEILPVDKKPISLIEDEGDSDVEQQLSDTNNGKLPSFNEIAVDNEKGQHTETHTEFSEWYQSVQAVSINEDLIVLPYVVID